MDENQIIDYKTLYEDQCRKVKELEHQLQAERIRLKKILANNQKGQKLCSKCLAELEHHKIANLKQDKEGFRDFSEKVTDKIKKINGKEKNGQEIPHNNHEMELELSHSLNLRDRQKNIAIPAQSPELRMLQNFTVFGVSEQSLQNYDQRDSTLGYQPELLYSYKPASDVDKQATKLVFPSGIGVKQLPDHRAKNKAIELISKSYTNLNPFVLRFKCQENIDEALFENDPFLSHINPEKSLFCLCVGIRDYTYVQENLEKSSQKNNLSLKIIEDYTYEDKQMPEQTVEGEKNQASEIEKNMSVSSKSTDLAPNHKIYLSHRVFCISSYYPFFTFYEQIFRGVLKIVKMDRLKLSNHNLAEIDSHFQLQKIIQLFLGCTKDLNARKIEFNRSYELKIAQQERLLLMTDWKLAKSYFIEEWIFTIISLFSPQTLLQVLTLVMLEEKIVFICQNSHILTYTIFLFTHILTKPFSYAFQVVNIIPNEDFLGAPFPVVYGLLKKRKYVEQSSIISDYAFTYIFLAPEKVEIVYTENKRNVLKAKPQRIKNQLIPLFKDLKRQRKPEQKTTKYELQMQEYYFSSTMQERKLAVNIVQKISQFIIQEVVSKLPTQLQIKHIKNSIDLSKLPEEKDQHSYLMDRIKDYVRKNNVREIFAERLIYTQMMSNFVCK